MEVRHDRPAPPPRRRVDGVVLVDKPTGLTSNAVLQRVKRAYRALKAGHTGTLDPLASGLLPVCLGEATKFSVGLLDADKGYRATLHLGVTTETGDAEGAVLRTREVTSARGEIEQALREFTGDIMQVPHRYSAIKREGRALYSYARAGEAVMVAPRHVHILTLAIEEWSPPMLTIRLLCSKGTYVRSLGEDLGEALGCGAHVSALRRLSVGDFRIERAVTLEAIESGDDASRAACLLPPQMLVEAFPVVELDAAASAKFQHGQKVRLPTGDAESGARVAVHGRAVAGSMPEFLGVALIEVMETQRLLVPTRLLATVLTTAETVAEKDLSA